MVARRPNVHCVCSGLSSSRLRLRCWPSGELTPITSVKVLERCLMTCNLLLTLKALIIEMGFVHVSNHTLTLT